MQEANGVITVNAVVDFKPNSLVRKQVVKYMAEKGLGVYNQNILPSSPMDACERYKHGRVTGLKWSGDDLTLEVIMDRPDVNMPKEDFRWHLTGRQIVGENNKLRNDFFVYYF